MVSTCFIPREHFRSPLSTCVPDQKHSPQPEIPGQANRPLSQKDWGYVSACCPCYVLGRWQLRTVSPFVTVPGDPRSQVQQTTRIKWSKGLTWEAAIKDQSTTHKNQTPDTCKCFLPSNIGILKCSVGSLKRQHHLLRCLKQIRVSPQISVLLEAYA